VLDQLRQEAEDTVRMLQSTVERRKAEEIKTDGEPRACHAPAVFAGNPDRFLPSFSAGLIILSATYGNLKSFSSAGLAGGVPEKEGSTAEPKRRADFIDVTVALQALVADSQLVIPPGRSKAGLLGFYDPCLGRRKSLCVRYLFRGRLHECTVGDTDGLLAPIRQHAIE
jgi:hypothetical protein